MSRPGIYLTRNIPGDAVKMLKQEFEVEINPYDRPVTREELLENIKGKKGIICQMTEKIDREVLEAAAEAGIRGFANYAVGYDNIDVKTASELHIQISNTPDVLTDATAEMAWALLFTAARKTAEIDRFIREGNWKGYSPFMFLGGGITGKTLGIIGAGRIGTAMALKSRGFGMKVLYTARRNNSTLDSLPGSEKVGLDELLKRSDFISLHVPSTEETFRLIGERELGLMKRSAYLINTARGPVVDEKALVNALQNRIIAGAGLDVFEKEPELSKEFLALDNVSLSPHIGSATYDARNNMGLRAAANAAAMVRGEKAPDCLNPEIF